MLETNAPFVYRASFEDWELPMCGVCSTLMKSGLLLHGITTLEEERHLAYICDACLMKLIHAVPLFEWGLREAQEAWAQLDG